MPRTSAQETFLRAWNRLDTFRPGTAMRVWLLRIAANAATDVRRRRIRVGFGPLEHDPPGASPARGTPSRSRSRPGSSGWPWSGSRRRPGWSSTSGPKEDLPFREVAGVVGITEEGARWHMHQARTKLLKQLAEKP